MSGFSGRAPMFLSSSVASGSAISLTNSTGANVTSISLTPGDWNVWGTIVYAFAGTTTITLLLSSVSTTSATAGNLATGFGIEQAFASFHPASDFSVPINPVPLTVAATTTVYLVAAAAFATSTCTAYGSIYAQLR